MTKLRHLLPLILVLLLPLGCGGAQPELAALPAADVQAEALLPDDCVVLVRYDAHRGRSSAHAEMVEAWYDALIPAKERGVAGPLFKVIEDAAARTDRLVFGIDRSVFEHAREPAFALVLQGRFEAGVFESWLETLDPEAKMVEAERIGGVSVLRDRDAALLMLSSQTWVLTPARDVEAVIARLKTPSRAVASAAMVAIERELEADAPHALEMLFELPEEAKHELEELQDEAVAFTQLPSVPLQTVQAIGMVADFPAGVVSRAVFSTANEADAKALSSAVGATLKAMEDNPFVLLAGSDLLVKAARVRSEGTLVLSEAVLSPEAMEPWLFQLDHYVRGAIGLLKQFQPGYLHKLGGVAFALSGNLPFTQRPEGAAELHESEAVAARPMPEVEKPAPVKRVTLPIPADVPVLGKRDAQVALHIFSDFQCPFCARLVPTMKKIEAEYGEQVVMVWHNNPLPFHEYAHLAAQASLEVYAQGGDAKFWAFHDLLFANPKRLSREDLIRYAKKVGGIKARPFRRALDQEKHRDVVERDRALASELGYGGTPTVLVNGEAVIGAQPFEVFKSAIERAMQERGAGGQAGPAVTAEAI